MYKQILTLSLGIVLAACNADSSSSGSAAGSATPPPSSPPLQDGRIIDSPVGGLVFETNSLVPATTDTNGFFQYREGEEVRFLLGEQIIGKSIGQSVLTLLDIVPGARAARSSGATLEDIYNDFPAILNIARLLQSVDIDRDSSNGIKLPIEVQQIAQDFGPLDFSSTDLYSSEESAGFKFICAVLEKRASAAEEAACDSDAVVTRDAAAAEVTATEEGIESGETPNQLPVVSAGEDQSAAEMRVVQLNGSASDPDGDSITAIQWMQSDRHGKSVTPTVTLENSDTYQAQFTAPDIAADQVFYFTLTVEDQAGGRGSDTVNVLVLNDTDLDPTASAEPKGLRVAPGASVTLDGSGSSDEEGPIASYAWTQTAGDTVTLAGADTVSPGFTAPQADSNLTLTFRLTVTDGSGQTDVDDVDVIVQVDPGLAPPTADAGEDQNITAGTVVELDGTASSDSDGDPLSHGWEQVDIGDGPQVTLENAATARASFTAPDVLETTTLNFRLTVSDGLSSASDSTSVTVTPAPTCEISDPTTFGLCFDVCTDQDPGTACPIPLEGGSDPSISCDIFGDYATQCEAVASACADPVTGAEACGGAIQALLEGGGGGELPVSCEAFEGYEAQCQAVYAVCTESMDPAACAGAFTTALTDVVGGLVAPSEFCSNFGDAASQCESVIAACADPLTSAEACGGAVSALLGGGGGGEPSLGCEAFTGFEQQCQSVSEACSGLDPQACGGAFMTAIMEGLPEGDPSAICTGEFESNCDAIVSACSASLPGDPASCGEAFIAALGGGGGEPPPSFAEALQCYQPTDPLDPTTSGDDCFDRTLSELSLGVCSAELAEAQGPCWPFETEEGKACLPFINGGILGAGACNSIFSLPELF